MRTLTAVLLLLLAPSARAQDGSCAEQGANSARFNFALGDQTAMVRPVGSMHMTGGNMMART